ncbi:hypothetical protein B0H17DRAFT_1129137 [Mycena rosella]|uniref:Uncharacterized protein n=1 Tax=Mycena rosella TaxID=1033263 RepID=A0AAD7GKM2_MYCRO|nr:hypothetical protein B0H17DRAFT_1129137 [Mycena rosella]
MKSRRPTLQNRDDTRISQLAVQSCLGSTHSIRLSETLAPQSLSQPEKDWLPPDSHRAQIGPGPITHEFDSRFLLKEHRLRYSDILAPSLGRIAPILFSVAHRTAIFRTFHVYPFPVYFHPQSTSWCTPINDVRHNELPPSRRDPDDWRDRTHPDIRPAYPVEALQRRKYLTDWELSSLTSGFSILPLSRGPQHLTWWIVLTDVRLLDYSTIQGPLRRSLPLYNHDAATFIARDPQIRTCDIFFICRSGISPVVDLGGVHPGSCFVAAYGDLARGRPLGVPSGPSFCAAYGSGPGRIVGRGRYKASRQLSGTNALSNPPRLARWSRSRAELTSSQIGSTWPPRCSLSHPQDLHGASRELTDEVPTSASDQRFTCSASIRRRWTAAELHTGGSYTPLSYTLTGGDIRGLNSCVPRQIRLRASAYGGTGTQALPPGPRNAVYRIWKIWNTRDSSAIDLIQVIGTKRSPSPVQGDDSEKIQPTETRRSPESVTGAVIVHQKYAWFPSGEFRDANRTPTGSETAASLGATGELNWRD